MRNHGAAAVRARLEYGAIPDEPGWIVVTEGSGRSRVESERPRGAEVVDIIRQAVPHLMIARFASLDLHQQVSAIWLHGIAALVPDSVHRSPFRSKGITRHGFLGGYQ